MTDCLLLLVDDRSSLLGNLDSGLAGKDDSLEEACSPRGSVVSGVCGPILIGSLLVLILSLSSEGGGESSPMNVSGGASSSNESRREEVDFLSLLLSLLLLLLDDVCSYCLVKFLRRWSRLDIRSGSSYGLAGLLGCL